MTDRDRTSRHYLMCRPEHFEVVSTLNPWMNPDTPVDRAAALSQWEGLVDVYEAQGHRVDLVQPEIGLPDMVFAANAAVIIDGRVMAAVMAADERRGEQDHYRKWFETAGFTDVLVPEVVNEGEGDFLFTGDVLLAGTGFRTDPVAHTVASDFFDVETVTLRLVDPRWYHLDTALFSVDGERIAWYPGAFDDASRTELRRRYPHGVEATLEEALAFGLNSTATESSVVMPSSAAGFGARIASEFGVDLTLVELSELLKAGGSVKCCTLEVRDHHTAGL